MSLALGVRFIDICHPCTPGGLQAPVLGQDHVPSHPLSTLILPNCVVVHPCHSAPLSSSPPCVASRSFQSMAISPGDPAEGKKHLELDAGPWCLFLGGRKGAVAGNFCHPFLHQSSGARRGAALLCCFEFRDLHISYPASPWPLQG